MSNDLRGVTFDGDQSPQRDNVIMTNDGLISKGTNIRENRWEENVPTSQQYYVVKLNGLVASSKYPTRFLAEQHINTLPQDSKMVAEVVIVDKSGKELLLG